ncbi:beta-ketoacyl synthase N-terminal-like domain-containing protein [Streptomyces sp. C8S0]|uniref:beta-ketoacyl synthase N-terminal-like domain-containing protein n=1 Tax=Streptomyces sp. C8S0 TaxID=2585716 RepID=UPI00125CFF84|nr:beta-ketoacyl synthase N-terminal-like domain-containing protein [Streptomyces sp. C8S0]
MSPQYFQLGSRHAFVLPDQRPAEPFDSAADGFVPGEGVVTVVLKPLRRGSARRRPDPGRHQGHGGEPRRPYHAVLTVPSSRGPAVRDLGRVGGCGGVGGVDRSGGGAWDGDESG